MKETEGKRGKEEGDKYEEKFKNGKIRRKRKQDILKWEEVGDKRIKATQRRKQE